MAFSRKRKRISISSYYFPKTYLLIETICTERKIDKGQIQERAREIDR